MVPERSITCLVLLPVADLAFNAALLALTARPTVLAYLSV
jgi:hypothetical protein